MSRAAPAIWIDVLQFALSWGVFVGFILTVSFIFATPISELDLGGKSLPEEWGAAYLNHGTYLRGYLIGSHPVGFALTLMLLLGSIIGLWLVRRSARPNMHSGMGSRTNLHKIVNFAMLAATIVMAIVLYRNVLAGVVPA